MSDRLPCPWPDCRGEFRDLWDYEWTGEAVVTECGACERSVTIVKHVQVDYTIEREGSE